MSSCRAHRPGIMVGNDQQSSLQSLILDSFPYAWVMVRDFDVGDKNSASFYAGIFISTFAFAESLTGMFWGGFSDRIGRKPVLLMGCAGTVLSMMVVGFAPNFWWALAGRALGGLLSRFPIYHILFQQITNFNRRWEHRSHPDNGRRAGQTARARA